MILLTNFGQTLIISMLAVLIMAVLFGLVYFVKTLGTLKKAQILKNEIESQLTIGQKVLFSNGLVGEVSRIGEQTVEITMISGVVEVRKESIYEII